MKELSVEQKAKLYDEAKSIMEKYLKSGNAGVIAENTIKKAFPELAESEDEKIRREIIRIVDIWTGSSPVVNGIPRETLLAWLEKQVEQKSTWNKEDEQNYDIILKIICSSNKSENLVNKLFNWLKSLKNRVQAKREWSEEEQQTIKDAASFILSCVNIAEAKEEEERLEELAGKLQDLKPQSQWKPSDGQMASITCAVRKMKESACYDSELVSLFNDLKKL